MPSSITIFNPELVIARLQSLNSPAQTVFRQVAGAADFLAAFDDLKQSPSVFVIPSAEAAGRTTAGRGVVRQRVTATCGVVIAQPHRTTSAARACRRTRPARR